MTGARSESAATFERSLKRIVPPPRSRRKCPRGALALQSRPFGPFKRRNEIHTALGARGRAFAFLISGPCGVEKRRGAALTCRGYEVAPDLGHLEEHEEEPEEPGDEDVGPELADARVRLGDDREVGALGAPERPAAQADGQARRYHGVEARVELGADEGHVGGEREGDRPLAAQPAVARIRN